MAEKHKKGDGTETTNGSTPFAAPLNMGKGLLWNPETKQYDVALGAGLYIDDNGVIQMRSNEPKIQTFDNGTGTVYHQQAIIDFGGLIEVSGTVNLPLPDLSTLNVFDGNDPRVVALNQRMKQLVPNMWVMTTTEANGVAIGLSNNPSEKFYYTEIGFDLDLVALGIDKVLAVNATAGDVYGFRKETAWVVNDITSSVNSIPVGLHVYFSEGQQTVSLSYTVKGTKR